MKLVINLVSVELGNTENHLLFKGYVPSLDNCHKYQFDFTGVDLTSTSGLSEKQLKRLKEKIRKDFGYAPFNEDKAKEILNGYKQYEIKM